MAKVKPIRPVDHVGYEPVMLAVSKARAAQHLVEFLDSASGDALDFKTSERDRMKDHADWIRQFGHDALTSALEEIETEYRKLGTNLLMKEAAADLKPKDGA
jgi:hypothetical protein